MDHNSVSVMANAHSSDLNSQTPGSFSTAAVDNHTHTVSTWTNSTESLFIPLGEHFCICVWNAQNIHLVTFPDY